jgi:hypothetical protein
MAYLLKALWSVWSPLKPLSFRSLKVRPSKQPLSVSAMNFKPPALSGYDAPELNQPFGDKAFLYLKTRKAGSIWHHDAKVLQYAL